jgi:hypothetical protein
MIKTAKTTVQISNTHVTFRHGGTVGIAYLIVSVLT